MNNDDLNKIKRIAATAQQNAPSEVSSATIRIIMMVLTVGGALTGLAIIAKAAGL